MLTFLIIWLLGAAWSIFVALKLELEQNKYVTIGFMIVAVGGSIMAGPVAAVISSILYLVVSGKADRFFSRIIIDRRDK